LNQKRLIVNYDNAKFTFTQNFKIDRNLTISFNLKGYSSFKQEVYHSLKINLQEENITEDNNVIDDDEL